MSPDGPGTAGVQPVRPRTRRGATRYCLYLTIGQSAAGVKNTATAFGLLLNAAERQFAVSDHLSQDKRL